MDNTDYTLTAHATQTTHPLLKTPMQQVHDRIFADFVRAQDALIAAMTDRMYSQED
jgi:hypothetical protein